MVAERTVQLLRERCPEAGMQLTIIGGESFLDQAFCGLGFDPIEGFALLDAADLQPLCCSRGCIRLLVKCMMRLRHPM